MVKILLVQKPCAVIGQGLFSAGKCAILAPANEPAYQHLKGQI